MSLESAPGGQSLASARSVRDVVREVVGSHTTVDVTEWFVRGENYVVASVETTRPALRLVVKLEIPGERPNRNFQSMAAIARPVRAHTAAPTFEVVAVDTSRTKWPWEYLIVTELAGTTWAKLYPQLDGAARSVAHRQIGRSAAQLHTLRFDRFGQIGPHGAVVAGTRAVAALRRRALQRLRTARYRDLLARLELWRLTTGSALRAGYGEVGHMSDHRPFYCPPTTDH